MKKIIIILIIILLIISFLIGVIINLVFETNDAKADSGEVYLPKITLSDLNNNKINFNKIEKPTILFFFLPQSKSCQQQLDILSLIKNRYNNRINIFAIAIGNVPDKELKKIYNRDITYPLFTDIRTKLTQKLKITAIPTLIFYKPHLEPIHIIGLKTETEVEKLINKNLLK